MAESLLPAVSIKSQFLSLPVDAISDVCLHLSPSDVIRLSRVCSGLYTLVKNLQGVWRLFCERVWLHAGPCAPGGSWYSEFCQWSGEWGQYSECYADIKRAWSSSVSNSGIAERTRSSSSVRGQARRCWLPRRRDWALNCRQTTGVS